MRPRPEISGAQAAHVTCSLHRMIVSASGNSVLLRLWESLAFETRARVRLWCAAIDMVQVKSSYEAITLGTGKKATPGRLHAFCRNTPRRSRRPTMG